MNKIIYISSLFLILSFGIKAQNIDDALRLNQRELTGTSRSLGMANAFGALGGDLSALSINPAGIAVYRSSEFAFTPSISLSKSTARFDKFKSSDDKYSFPFNQIGGVATYKPLRNKTKGIVSTHFGFTYNRTADFNSNTNIMLLQGVTDEFDQAGNMTRANTLLGNALLNANGYTPIQTKNDANNNVSALQAYLAMETFLINPVKEIDPDDIDEYNRQTEFYNEYDFMDRDNNTYYNKNVNGIDQKYIIESEGYSGEYGFTFGANVSNVILIGASLNFQSFKLDQTHRFREINNNSFNPSNAKDLDYYDLYTRINQDGFGANGKLGIILNLHPLRIGASIHTPTFYNIDKEEYDGMQSYFLNYDSFHKKSNKIYDYSYKYRTPYRATGSAALVLGKFALLSIDYEYTDHTSAKFKSENGYANAFDGLNKGIKEQFKAAHNYRAGIEIKPVPFISLRAGAAYFDSPLKDEYNSINMEKWMATAGFGFRNKNFFFDIAYAQMRFDDSYSINENPDALSHPQLDPLYYTGIELENKKHQASFTLGWKF